MLNPSPLLLCAEVPGTYMDRGELESADGARKACRFKRTWLKGCSGMEDKTFGFQSGKPCLLVKLNRIVNFRPKVSLQKYSVDTQP